MRRSPFRLLLLMSFAIGWISGCDSPLPPPTPQEVHLKHLAVYYGQYTGAHQGSGPASEADFKAFIKGASPNMTDQQLADLFVSPRDQKPYVVAYKVKLGPMPQSGAPIVAHEEVGVEGKYFAADSLGAVQEVGQDELKQRAFQSL